MEDTEDNHLVSDAMLMQDDVGKSRYGPFAGAHDLSRMTEVRKLAKTIGFGENELYDVRRRVGASRSDVSAD